MSDIYTRRQFVATPATPVERFCTPAPLLGASGSEFQTYQPVRRETVRVTRRHVQTRDGHAGIEITEEHDVVYGAPRTHERHESDLIRTSLAAFAAFIIICVVFTALGGKEQSAGLIPVYWGAFAALWWALS